MGLISMTSNLAWQGLTNQAPGKYPQEKIQNKISSFHENEIMEQYDKFHIYDAPNVNRLSLGVATDQPFIIRGIQRRGGDVQFYGPGGRTSPDNMMVRGGLVAFAARLAEDTLRFAKFMISPKGILWNIKQVGLQASNPYVESNIKIRPTRAYNPIRLASNLLTAPEGIHNSRHGSKVIQGKYEDVQKELLNSDAEAVTKNRLARLKIEMFGDGAPASLDQAPPTDLLGTIAQGISNFVEPLQNAFSNFDGSEISELSGPGGPKSVYGIGYTTIRRTVVTGTGLKDNLGNAYWGIHYASTTPYESEDVPGSPRTLENTGRPGNSIEKTFNNPGSTGEYKKDKGAFLPSKDATTGGTGVKNVLNIFSPNNDNEFYESGYIQSDGPRGGRFISTETTPEKVLEAETLKRPKVDITTGLLGDDGKTIHEGTPESDDNTFAIGTRYLESNSPAQNVSKKTAGGGQQVEPHSPGGGRYVGTSDDASEETHQRAKNTEDKDLLEHSHKYHLYQNREDGYPEGYYNLINANSGPRGKPIGGSKHNIYTSIEQENELVRTLIDSKKLTEHIHTFVHGHSSTYPIQSSALIEHIKGGYLEHFLRSTPVIGEDWDVDDRISLYGLIDPNGDASNTNTPQIRKSAERVFEPGFPVNMHKEAKLIAARPVTGLNEVQVGEAIFNYFTPDLKFFTGNTKEQIDEGPSHDYKSLRLLLEEYKGGDPSTGTPFVWIYGGDDPSLVPTYNDKSYSSKYTSASPKKGPSPDAGQVAISDQESKQLEAIDAEIVSKLDPMQNPDARPDETSGTKTIGGKPKSSAGTPLVYNYMNYSEIRDAAKQTGTVAGTKKIQEFRRAVSTVVKGEIKLRNRDMLGYGGANQHDTLNRLPVGGKPIISDLVPFYISMHGSQTCYFRAGINSISDSFSPEWNQEKEIGRADPKLILTGWGRTISLDLTLAAGSKRELSPMWDKINTVAGWTAPKYHSNGYTGTFVNLTLGDIYDNIPCYISTFSVDMDSETPWEITAGQRMPKYATVSLELQYVGSSIPQRGGIFFGGSTFKGDDVQANADANVEQKASNFDAIDDLIEGLPPGVNHIADKPYNMAKDILGDVGDGVVSAGDNVLDFILPGDQSGDNAASSKISGVAEKAFSKESGKKVLNFLNPFD